MNPPEYRFRTVWRFPGATLAEIADVLNDAEALPRWWGDVYLSVVTLERGDADGVGRIVAFESKGWLPYRLRWRMTTREVVYPSFAVIEADGDLAGRGVWRHVVVADTVVSTYEWRVRANKPLLRWGSFVLRPLFRANHDWAMRNGERALSRELERRRSARASNRTSSRRA